MTVGAWNAWWAQYVEPTDNPHRTCSNEPSTGRDDPRALFITQDSRRFPDAPTSESAFVAIRGQWHDGHDYLEQAYASGARRFIVAQGMAVPEWPDADVVWAVDPVICWQQLVRFWREHCATPIIAVTGSNGKTTVKEWLAHLLSSHFDVYSSPRSYNSQVGVPLALGELTPRHAVGIIEAGISHPDEMQRLAQCIHPNYGVLTHLGEAHLEHFASKSELLTEKLKLFEGCAWVALPAQLTTALRALKTAGIETKTWGSGPSVDLEVEGFVHPHGRTLQVHWAGQSYTWSLPFADEMAFRNAMTAALTALVWGLNPHEVGQALAEFKDLDHRMQRLHKPDGNWVLSDAYTNDWDALQLALLDVKRIPGAARTAAIIGPVPGMGPDATNRLVALAEGAGMDSIWAVGNGWDPERMPKRWRSFSSTQSALDALVKTPAAFDGANVLVKGPRVERFERFVERLTQKGHTTKLVLDLEALTHNLNVLRGHIRNHAPHGTELMGVIKASGYGTNAPAMARVLQFHRVPLVAVACTEEGVELRKHGISMRILVLNPTASTWTALLAHRLEPTVHSLVHYEALVDALKRSEVSTPWPVHIKIDSGMHRLGFDPLELDTLKALVHRPETHVKTVFSHLASADRPEHDDRTERQLTVFRTVVDALKVEDPRIESHILNTAGLVRFPAMAGNYIRAGIGMLGIDPTGNTMLDLHPVVRFETNVSSLHTVPANEGVGYGFEDASETARLVATLPVGYADGFPRNLSNGVGAVVIRGQLARVVGKVCMDMVMVDVTHLPGIQIGDAVEIFGQTQRIEAFALAAQTIPYEILTRIPSRVEREQRGN